MMATTARASAERIEFRTTPELRRLVERAVDASDSTLTDFAEASLVFAAQHVMADRDTFALSEDAAAEWEALNDFSRHLVDEFEPSPTDELHLVLLLKDVRRTLQPPHR